MNGSAIDELAGIEASPERKTPLAETLKRRILSMELASGAAVDELALCDESGLSRRSFQAFPVTEQ